MYEFSYSRIFKRSYTRLEASGMLKGKARVELKVALQHLKDGTSLAQRNKDHALTGRWKGYRECHIKGDLLLVYRRSEEKKVIVLVDIGNHANIFG